MDDNSIRIIQEIANEEGIKYSEAEECVRAQFDFARDTIAEGSFEGACLPYFGKLWVDPRRVEHLNNSHND